MKKILSVIIITFAFFQACEDEKKTKAPSIPANLVTVNTDYSTGSMSLINSADCSISTSLKGTISGDPAVRSFNGYIYVINRSADNIMRINPSDNNSVAAQESTGTGSNPHDICVVNSSKAYVTRYNANELWIVDPLTLKKTNEISLASYAPVNAGNPSMDMMYYDSARSLLFIALQRFSSKSGWTWTLDTYSSVIVIDTTTDTVKKEIKLSWTIFGIETNATNPYSDFASIPSASWQPTSADNHDHLFISCVGYQGTVDCGIIAIDPVTLECETGYVVSEQDHSSDIMSMSTKGTELYAITQNSSWMNTVYRISLETKSITQVQSEGKYPSMALYTDGKLYVCDNSISTPGIRIFDTSNSDKAINSSPISTETSGKGLPPFSITLIK
jgi:hypothetical protein